MTPAFIHDIIICVETNPVPNSDPEAHKVCPMFRALLDFPSTFCSTSSSLYIYSAPGGRGCTVNCMLTVQPQVQEEWQMNLDEVSELAVTVVLRPIILDLADIQNVQAG
jgi:hypothetical protein